MKFLFKNTKIVSTFGPSVTLDLSLGSDRDNLEVRGTIEKVQSTIRDLIFSGMNCVRFNFSHGLHEENKMRSLMIYEVQKKMVDSQSSKDRKYLRPITILSDTKGPEIRVFDMGPNGVKYSMGQIVTVNCLKKVKGSNEGFSVVDSTGIYNMANDCIEGNFILLEDGKLTMKIISVDQSLGIVKAEVKNTHVLKTNKRINLPGADYSMDFLSEKDISDIKYSIDNGFEYVALSFVNSRENVMSVRSLIDSYCKEKGISNFMKVYSKIETLKSCRNIDEIIDASDGIMIARGDLGLEIPYYEVPYWTKEIIRKCRQKQKPAITATQMLDSLERNVVATRAEVSDVYRAAELGSDCTMLSGETAQGMFPVLSVQTMTNIVFESEKHFNVEKFKGFFDKDIYVNLSSALKQKLNVFFEDFSKFKNPAALIFNFNDVSDQFLIAISSSRINVPMFVFLNVGDVLEYCSEPNWKSEDYLYMKKLSSLSLHRSIYPIFYSGPDEVGLNVIFSEFAKTFGYEGDSLTFLYFDGNNLSESRWK